MSIQKLKEHIENFMNKKREFNEFNFTCKDDRHLLGVYLTIWNRYGHFVHHYFSLEICKQFSGSEDFIVEYGCTQAIRLLNSDYCDWDV